MTPTDWLLAGLIVLFLLGLFAIFISKMINTKWKRTDEPAYRTADGAAIARQTRRIIANAAAHASAHQGSGCCCNLTTARREGTAAALHDMGQKPGTPPTANPYPHDALAHVAWRRAYQHTNRSAGHDVSDDCTPNHLCKGRMVHLPVGEQCDNCGAAKHG